MSTIQVLPLALACIGITISIATLRNLRQLTKGRQQLAESQAALAQARQQRNEDAPPNITDPALVGNAEGNHHQAAKDHATITALIHGWPPDPSIECGFTAPDGHRWIHYPWEGWRDLGPHPTRRRKHWRWSR